MRNVCSIYNFIRNTIIKKDYIVANLQWLHIIYVFWICMFIAKQSLGCF